MGGGAEQLLPTLGRDSLVSALVVLVGLVLFLVGLNLGSLRRRRETPEPPQPRRPVFDGGHELLENYAQVSADRDRLARALKQLMMFAEKVAREEDRRRVFEHIVQVLDSIFDANDILVFTNDPHRNGFVLVHRKSQGPGPQRGAVVPVTEGFIAQVVALGVAKDDHDLKTQAGFHSSNAPALGERHQRPALCAPMLAGGDELVLGVIALYGVKRRFREERGEKTILKFVSTLGAVVLQMLDLKNEQRRAGALDGLTNLNNKRVFVEQLQEKLERADAGIERSPLSLLMFDVDHFKNYNDCNGHLAGDDALKLTAKILQENLRKDDIAARFGGEEFVILLPGLEKEQAAQVAEKLRRKIEEHPFPFEESQPSHVLTISGGVATYPEDGLNDRELLASADRALYRAKRAGRNRICLHEPEQTYFSAKDEMATGETGETAEILEVNENTDVDVESLDSATVD